MQDAFQTARAFVIHKMMLNPSAEPRHILQAWFSTALEPETLELLIQACHDSLSAAPDACELDILRWIAHPKVTRRQVVEEWAYHIYPTEYDFLNLLTRERDRVEYAEYLHGGAVFIGDNTLGGLVGNPTFLRPAATQRARESLDQNEEKDAMKHFRPRESLLMALSMETYE